MAQTVLPAIDALSLVCMAYEAAKQLTSAVEVRDGEFRFYGYPGSENGYGVLGPSWSCHVDVVVNVFGETPLAWTPKARVSA